MSLYGFNFLVFPPVYNLGSVISYKCCAVTCSICAGIWPHWAIIEWTTEQTVYTW